MFVIRPECIADVAAIRAVHEAAFPTPAEANLVDRLRQSANARISLVAEDEGRVVGHVLFSPVAIVADEVGQTIGLGLAPLAVLPERQRRGIGSRLVIEGLAECRRQRQPFIVVLGHTDYYPRFGFERASRRGIRNEYGADEAFMVLELRPQSLPAVGLAKYGAEFAELGE
jgi:putative acetyltransferase